LYAGDQPVASSLNFLLNGRWHSYMKGFDPAWGHARPGTVLDALRIEQAITEQARQFDFGRGDESYKSGYGVTDEQNTRLLLGNGTRRSGAAFGIMALRISVRHFQERAAPATGLDGGVAEEDATDTVQAASAANRAT
jgi:CelD/BcsL family acetyltransferase involved in cellulose biosynthesis